MLKAYSRTEESYTDQFLYEILCSARAEILRQQLVKFNHISEENIFRFCLELELTKAHDCNCVPDNIDCLVLKSKYKIPTALTSRNKTHLNIALLNGQQVTLVTEQEWIMYSMGSTFGELFGSIINGYLYIWNASKKLKIVQVSGIFSDILELQNIPNCDGTLNQPTCYNPLTQPYPLQDEYTYATYSKAFQLLNIPMAIQQDLTNDSSNTIKI